MRNFKVKLIGSEKGQVLVFATLLLPVLIVFIGLAVDGGLLWELKRRMQTAADSGAVAGAIAKRSGGDITAITNAGRADAATNRFQHGVASVTVTVNTPPTSGPYAGNGGYVEAIVSQVAQTHFVRLFSLITGGSYGTATVRARAVAGLEGQDCIYAMNPTINGGLTLNGTPSLNAPECGAYVGSNSFDAMHLEGQASLNLASINIVGQYTCQGQSCNNINPEPNTGVTQRPDPLAGLPVPTPVGPCIPSPASDGGSAVTLSPGRYCDGIKLEGIPAATFQPGTYYIEDNDGDGTGFRITGTPVVTGTEVFFYIAAGQLKIAGGANVNLSAPTSGPFKGILFFQNRTSTTEVILTGGTQLNLNGAIYALGAKISYSGGSCSTSTPKTLIVADRIQFVGTSCITRPDDLPPSAGQLVLAE
jgi:Putative Flp pilus-assembly TadE/G-like